MALTPLAYFNNSGQDIPPYSVIQGAGPCKTDASGDYKLSMSVPWLVTGSEVDTEGGGYVRGPLFIDSGQGTTASGPGQYGACYVAGEGPMWVAFSGSAPAVPNLWQPVGPEPGNLTMSIDNGGFVFCGNYDATNKLALVMRDPNRWYWAFLQGNLLATGYVGSGEITPTTASAILWQPDISSVSGGSPQLLTSNPLTITVVNYDYSYSAPTGTLIKVEPGFGLWSPYASACGAP